LILFLIVEEQIKGSQPAAAPTGGHFAVVISFGVP
jgi:hypothetical protein